MFLNLTTRTPLWNIKYQNLIDLEEKNLKWLMIGNHTL